MVHVHVGDESVMLPQCSQWAKGGEFQKRLTCLTAALKAPRIPAAPPQSRFIPGIPS